MPLIGRPKVPKSLPKGLGAEVISEILGALETDGASQRSSDWALRDRAIVQTAVLAGLPADELIRASIGDIRITDAGGVLHVRGKGNKDRRIPLEQSLIDVLKQYLESRATRFATDRKRQPKTGLAAWVSTSPLFVGPDGDRITPGGLLLLCRRVHSTEPPHMGRHLRGCAQSVRCPVGTSSGVRGSRRNEFSTRAPNRSRLWVPGSAAEGTCIAATPRSRTASASVCVGV